LYSPAVNRRVASSNLARGAILPLSLVSPLYSALDNDVVWVQIAVLGATSVSEAGISNPIFTCSAIFLRNNPFLPLSPLGASPCRRMTLKRKTAEVPVNGEIETDPLLTAGVPCRGAPTQVRRLNALTGALEILGSPSPEQIVN
jgi:hypothetical protein